MKCFVIMPFAETFDPVFETVRQVATTAVPGTSVECYWLKDVHAAGRITDDILEGLGEAAFCIADVSGHNPNVMWETGYAMALGKPTILIGQDIDALPFDLKSHRVLEYSSGSVHQFRHNLGEAIRQTLSRYALKGSGASALTSVKPADHRTITVTGTMGADEAIACRRLEPDDEASVRDLLTRVLGNAGHQVVAVETGEAALLKLARERFDILVVDKNLPGMDGLDVMRLVRTHHPHLRAIMITAYPTTASEQAAADLGVHSYVTKPFGIVTIVSAVDEAIRAGRAGR